MTPLPAWLLVAVALACLGLGAWAYQRARRWWLGRALRRRMRRARRGEDDARAWLERHGFTVLEAQVTQSATLGVDGVETPFAVRADYLVERNGIRSVVEVKTGSVASPAARETRRQILEYAWVYDVAEVYLFDADAEVLRRITVPSRRVALAAGRSAAAWPHWLVFALGAGAGAAAAAAWYGTR